MTTVKTQDDEVKTYYSGYHVDNQGYGVTSVRNAGPEILRTLGKRKQCTSMLDIGAGKARMEPYIAEHLPRVKVTSYDPSIPGIDKLPEGQFDVTMSTDVCEHIDYPYLDDFIKQCFDKARRTTLHHIACFPTETKMPDGRDLHLVVEEPQWWKDKFVEIGQGEWTVMEWREVHIWKRGGMWKSCYMVLDKYKLPE